MAGGPCDHGKAGPAQPDAAVPFVAFARRSTRTLSPAPTWMVRTTVELPIATFVGERVEGSLRVEREVNDHPGVTRGVGLFGADVLPENCRDRSDLLDLFASPGD